MKNLGLLVLWGLALVQSANGLFFCLRNNPCWGALGVVGGLLDCLGNLVITVTPPAVTQTKTITAVVSAVDTVTVTTSTTATVATTTLLFTESTTTTASTATNTVLQTTTVLTTSTNIQTAPGITTTTTVYGSPPTEKMARDNEVVARGNNPWGIPDYAWPACRDWDHYVDACKCFGIHPITVTKKPTTTTVTVTASNAITTTVSTLTTTTTNTVPVTATTSATFTAVIEVIASATITQTVTQVSTIVVSTTTTPTVISTVLCKATGVPFRVAEAPGDPRHLGVVFGVFVAWAAPDDPPPVPTLEQSTFVLDNNGFIELATPPNPGDPDQVLLIDLGARGATVSETIYAQSQDIVEADPNIVRIKGCIDPATNVLSLSAAGRNNILDCEGIAYLSSGDGSDTGLSCATLAPVAE